MKKVITYEISGDTLASLVQRMALSQEVFIYEQMILRTVSEDFKGYTDVQQEKLQERIDVALPYQARSLGGDINMLLDDYPELNKDEFVIAALEMRDKAIKFVYEANIKSGYKPKPEFNPSTY